MRLRFDLAKAKERNQGASLNPLFVKPIFHVCCDLFTKQVTAHVGQGVGENAGGAEKLSKYHAMPCPR